MIMSKIISYLPKMLLFLLTSLLGLVPAHSQVTDPPANLVEAGDEAARNQQQAEALSRLLNRLDRDNLGYMAMTYGSDCPFSMENYIKTITDAFVRSRLKAVSFEEAEEPFLFVSVRCLNYESPAYIYYVEAGWAAYNPYLIRYYTGSGAEIGVGDAQSILEGVENSVEKALVDYIRTNWDLD